MSRCLIVAFLGLTILAGCSDSQSPTTPLTTSDFTMSLRVQAGPDPFGTKDIDVEQLEVTELAIQVIRVEDGFDVGSFIWVPADGTIDYTLFMDEAGQYEVIVTHYAVSSDGPVSATESAILEVLPMIITRVTITPGQMVTFGGPPGDISLINGDFENGTFAGWTPIWTAKGDHMAVNYTEVPGWMGPHMVVTPYPSGMYGGLVRTGDGEEAGYEQTIEVPANKAVFYHLDFVVRENQIPSQERAMQTVRLYLNDELVDELYVQYLDEVAFAFEGSYFPQGETLTFRMVSYRPLNAYTGWGQVIFDNAEVSLTP